MDINEQWVPIIFEGIKWVKEKMKPTKKELKLKVSDLEEQVKILSYGNQVLINNIDKIVSIIISQLETEGHYIINADTIIQIKENSGQVYVSANNKICNTRRKNTYSIFDNMDEEIIQCKLTYPSERNEKNGNIKKISKSS